MTQPQTFELRDGDRTVVTEGWLLAMTSSAEEGKPRWCDMELYRTVSGKYVVHGAGMTSVPGETTRPWVSICDTAESLVSTLTRQSGTGVNYIPFVNKALLTHAAVQDTAVHDAYYTQRVA